MVDVKGNVEWKIDHGDIDDLKDLKSDKNTTYSAKDAWVMKTVDDETARLVYIFWTETEKGDTRDITFTAVSYTHLVGGVLVGLQVLQIVDVTIVDLPLHIALHVHQLADGDIDGLLLSLIHI